MGSRMHVGSSFLLSVLCFFNIFQQSFQISELKLLWTGDLGNEYKLFLQKRLRDLFPIRTRRVFELDIPHYRPNKTEMISSLKSVNSSIEKNSKFSSMLSSFFDHCLGYQRFPSFESTVKVFPSKQDIDMFNKMIPNISMITKTIHLCEILSTLPGFDTFHFSHTFCRMSYEQGLRHIHSLEHLENVHHVSHPGFHIIAASKPTRIVNKISAWSSSSAFVCVLFECGLLQKLYHDKMINVSSVICECRQFAFKRDESHILVCSGPSLNQPIAYFRFKVSPLLNKDKKGHKLDAEITLRSIQSLQFFPVKNVLISSLKLICMLEDDCFWNYDFKLIQEPILSNLARYRRLILFSGYR
jgi:hypothetical protein